MSRIVGLIQGHHSNLERFVSRALSEEELSAEQAQRASVARAYLRFLTSAQTLNQINKLHIRFDNRMTPREQQLIVAHQVKQIERGSFGKLQSGRLSGAPGEISGDAAAPALDVPSTMELLHQWSLQWQADMAGDPDPGARSFFRSISTRGVSVYSSSRPSNSVLLCFTGRANRMGLPTPNLLRSIPASEGDVVLVRAASPPDYDRGIFGLGDRFLTALEALRTLVDGLGYSKINVLGSSAGALPAVLAAHYLGAENAIAMGPSEPGRVSLRSGFGPQWSYRKAVRKLSRRNPPNVAVFYGEQAPQDEAPARELAALVDGSVTAVPGAPHLFFDKFYQEGRLRDFILDSTSTAKP